MLMAGVGASPAPRNQSILQSTTANLGFLGGMLYDNVSDLLSKAFFKTTKCVVLTCLFGFKLAYETYSNCCLVFISQIHLISQLFLIIIKCC